MGEIRAKIRQVSSAEAPELSLPSCHFIMHSKRSSVKQTLKIALNSLQTLRNDCKHLDVFRQLYLLISFLQSEVVPLEWKAARGIPLFKKGKSDDMDNYRPLSVLPVVSKVLERAVHHQLYADLQCHLLVSRMQSEGTSIKGG